MTVSNDHTSPFAGLQHWYRSPLGRRVAQLEGLCVRRLLSTSFGYYLLQIGLTELWWEALATCRIRHQVLLTSAPANRSAGLTIAGAETDLPLAADSIDAVLLPHTLDFTTDPRRVLCEVERVLIPEGRVIVVGFNAVSFWGLWHLALGSQQQMPWCGRFKTAAQIESWLESAGFVVEVCEHLLFCPPLRQVYGAGCSPLEALGQRLWPFFGGVYVIRAVKRVATLTPLKPAWSRRCPVLPGTAVRPTTRGNDHG
ncbi:class I SAM-dependent methyltransferase [Chromatium okenii]|uniref:class I SAM-dependent methyltransferase n=1 Tax=Chromatium okenii TaxID=61644 RepID=UPI0026EAD9A6|nr:methyltransferase domain-containing protein [Chromatium okenii]MBV5310461.1 methyltransferase domain-containing protein [Chromatium okenii]